MGCGCQTPDCTCDSPLHGYFLGAPSFMGSLAAITPDQAAEAVFPQSQVKKSAGHNQNIRDQLVAAAAAGQITGNTPGVSDYIPGTPQCAAVAGGGGISNLQLTQTASGLALTGTSIGLVASGLVTAAALAPWTMGISAIIGLFPLLFGHHAQAVKKEQSVLCTAVPAANNYLQIIAQAVASGKATPQQGIDALNSLLSDFESQVSSIRHGSDPTSSGECNAACVEQSKLHAVVLLMQSEYQDMLSVPAPPAPVTVAPTPASPSVIPTRPNVVAAPGTPTASSYASFYSSGALPAPSSSAPTPSWLPIAAVALGAFFLMKAM